MAHDRIAIIGAGLTGLMTALALAAQDFPVLLIGPDPKDKSDGRTTAIMQAGIAFLKSLNVWKECAPQATPLMTMELVDGPHHHVFSSQDIGLNEFGFNIPNDVLKAALVKKIASTKNMSWQKTLLHGMSKTPTGWTLRTTDKKSHNVSLLIGADGGKSVVRERTGIDAHYKQSDQMAMVALLEGSRNHHFASIEWYRSGGPFTLVPVDDKNLAMVWCDDEAVLQEKSKLSSSALARELTALTEKRFGDLAIKSSPQIWPVRPMKAQRMIGDHIALIGEAAHVLPPIGAQGLNTGIQDILALSNVLVKGKSLGLPPSDASLLLQYERQRLPDITARFHATNSLNSMIRAQHPAARFLRRAAMKLLDAAPPLKKGVMRAGLGRAA